MRDFIVSVGIGVAVGLAWLFIRALVLRAFGVNYFARTPEERGARRERLIKMGKWQYILIFGVMGWGFAVGLAVSVANMSENAHHGLIRFAIRLLLFSILGGWWQGARTWNDSVCGEVPFPPPWLSQK